MTEALLVAERLSRRFGGLSANEDVSITLERGRLHALLGPNGAGKSTCINLLSGDLAPSSGRITYKGRDITHLSAPQRSRVGIGRSYQRTNIFGGFTQTLQPTTPAHRRVTHMSAPPTPSPKATSARASVARPTACSTWATPSSRTTASGRAPTWSACTAGRCTPRRSGA